MTVVRCPICGNSAKVDEELQGGEQLDCPYCNRTFTYGRKKGVSAPEVKHESTPPQRVNLPGAGMGTPIQQARNMTNQDSNEALQSSVCMMKRAKVIIQKALSKKYLRIWVGVVCLIAIVCVVDLVRSKSKSPTYEASSLITKVAKAETKYGTNSVEYIEARLDFLRKVGIKLQLEGAIKHRDFLKMLDRSAYMVTYYEHQNGTLSYLVVLNKYTGANGIMSAGMQDGQFNYPRWMPAEDAKMIWRHYYYEAAVTCESELEETEKLINELEMRLQQLKSQR